MSEGRRDFHHLLARTLAEQWAAGRVVSVTWVNHFSGRLVIEQAPTLLAEFDYVGVDGILLQALLSTPHARLAGGGDATLPLLLPLLPNARVILVGGVPSGTVDRADAVRPLLAPGAEIVLSVDGYEGLPSDDELATWVAQHRPDVVVIGMGAVRQDRFAQAVVRHMDAGLAITCGGWMDQIAKPSGYYPFWVYRARLNWAVRLAREPRRLWRRYTWHAAQALAQRHRLRSVITAAPGYQRYLDAVEGSDDVGSAST